MSDRKKYFCNEPWDGIFSIETNLDVTFCPCFLKMNIGNLNQNSLNEIWNSEKLLQLRKTFSTGDLPQVCEKQLCSVALSKSSSCG
jgi:MoaA/NifB/PqqE/SkfB family radical SAM enzyme